MNVKTCILSTFYSVSIMILRAHYVGFFDLLAETGVYIYNITY